MIVLDKKILFLCIAAFAIGFFASKAAPAPEQERPVLAWIAKAAKTFLWVALFAEEPKAYAASHKHVGDDVLNHGEGW